MGLRKTWEVVGEATLVDGTRSLSALARHGITVRQGRVEHLDPANLRATIQGEQVGADAIVIALGAEHAPEAIPGLVEHGINVWDREGASRARAALERFAGGRLSIGVFGTPYSCPPGPFELAILASERLGRRGGKGGWTSCWRCRRIAARRYSSRRASPRPGDGSRSIRAPSRPRMSGSTRSAIARPSRWPMACRCPRRASSPRPRARASRNALPQS